MLISILTILTLVFSLTVVYPKVVLTVVFIPTVVYILTVVLAFLIIVHNTVHTLSTYPAVRVKFYAYVNMLGRNDLIHKLTYYLLERKAVAAKETNARTTRMTDLVKGSSLQLRQKFHSHFLQNSFDFQKSADLNRHLECTDVSFKPESGAFSKIKK